MPPWDRNVTNLTNLPTSPITCTWSWYQEKKIFLRPWCWSCQEIDRNCQIKTNNIRSACQYLADRKNQRTNKLQSTALNIRRTIWKAEYWFDMFLIWKPLEQPNTRAIHEIRLSKIPLCGAPLNLLFLLFNWGAKKAFASRFTSKVTNVPTLYITPPISGQL